MRRILLISSVGLIAGASSACPAAAGDRYGPPEPVKPANVSAVQWNGPSLGWTNKASPDGAQLRSAASVTSKSASTDAPIKITPASVMHATPGQPTALPTSIYAPPVPAPIAAASAPSAYQTARPTGEVLTLSLADLAPPGPSLERQQAAENDAAVLAAQVARANAQAAKDIAAGKPVTGGNTDLLGGL